MILEELTAYVVATTSTSPPLAVGVNVFMHSFPATAADTAACFYETGGTAPVESFGGVVAEAPNVQVVARSDSYTDARDLAQTVFNKMVAVKNVSLSSSTAAGTWYVSGHAQQSPFDIGDDASGRPQISCNYRIQKEVSST